MVSDFFGTRILLYDQIEIYCAAITTQRRSRKLRLDEDVGFTRLATKVREQILIGLNHRFKIFVS